MEGTVAENERSRAGVETQESAAQKRWLTPGGGRWTHSTKTAMMDPREDHKHQTRQEGEKGGCDGTRKVKPEQQHKRQQAWWSGVRQGEPGRWLAGGDGSIKGPRSGSG